MFEFDQDFQQRWHNTPMIIRQVYQNDLARIEQLFDLDTEFTEWKEQEKDARQYSQQLIEQSYQEIIADLTQRNQELTQLILEKRLNQKRAEEQAHLEALEQEEQQRIVQQDKQLLVLNQKLQNEREAYVDRYLPNMPHTTYLTEVSQQEDLRLRLEMEAELLIQATVQQFRQQLRQIAKEEIDYLLKQEEKKH